MTVSVPVYRERKDGVFVMTKKALAAIETHDVSIQEHRESLKKISENSQSGKPTAWEAVKRERNEAMKKSGL